MFSINFNDWVKVKLTAEGIAILKEQREELNKYIRSKGNEGLGEYEYRPDENGYTSMQFWILMETFGPYMDISKSPPIEAKILFDKDREVKETPLLSIVVDDIKKLPEVKYKGQTITGRILVDYTWETSGKHEINIEYADKDTLTTHKIGIGRIH